MDSKKCLVLLLGAGSSGKTTTRQKICGEPVEKIIQVEENNKIFCTLYENFAVAGNHNSGSDANTGPTLIVKSAIECFKHRDIVFFDGVMGTPALLEIPKQVDCSVLLVHYNLSQSEVITRLLNRRKKNGKIEDCLPEKTLKNSIAFRQRAISTLKHFENKCASKLMKIEILDGDSVEDATSKILKGIQQCWSMPTPL